MHYSTKTSTPVIYVLAIGLTILLRVGAAPSTHQGDAALTAPATAPVVSQSTAIMAGDFAAMEPSMLMSVQHSVCDRCRTVCARSCSSYACLVCDRAPKCRLLVESCLGAPTKH